MAKRTKAAHLDLVYKASELYYSQNLNKTDVANILSVSVTHVSRLLTQAEALGVVKIDVKVVGRLARLEDEVRDKYDLREVKIVETSPDYELTQRNLGVEAGKILEDRIRRETRSRIGIGGGQTIYRLVESLDERPRPIDIYPMSLFGRGSQVEYVDSVFVSMLLYMKSRPSARGFLVGSPPLPSKPESAKAFAKWIVDEIPEVREVLEGVTDSDLSFVGAGTFMASRDILKEYEKLGLTFEHMKKAGVVGGINYNYFDENGWQIGEGVLTTSIESLRRMSSDPMKLVTLVVGGQHKKIAARVALETKMVNSLVTDEDLALYLLKDKERGHHG